MGDNSTNHTIYYVADPSVSGTLTLTGVCAATSLACFLAHEAMRKQKPFLKLFYTRVEACRKEAPDIPQSIFGWARVAVTIPESYVVEKVGLDAAMFLRFLKMSFMQFLLLMFAVTPALTCINYFAAPNTDIQFPQLGLSAFSISNVSNGSSWLIAHTVYTLLVSLCTYYTLFRAYKDFASLCSTYLREDNSHGGERPAWRANEALQLRTVLVQNIPHGLRSSGKLRDWFDGLGVGEVEVAILDRSITSVESSLAVAGHAHPQHHDRKRNAQMVISKLIHERTLALNGLEKAYLQWSLNIAAAKRKLQKKRQGNFELKWGIPLFGEVGTISQAFFTRQDSSLDVMSAHLTEEEVARLRPKLFWPARAKTTRLDKKFMALFQQQEKRGTSVASASSASHDPGTDDAIEYYTNRLNTLTAMVKLERVKALNANLLNVDNQDVVQENGSAFVTFKAQRSAQIAAQVLLYSSFNRYKMRISLAPAPQDVIWPTISMHPIRRQVQSWAVNIIAVAFTFFWIVPASTVAALTNLDSLAKFAPLAPAIHALAQNPSFYVFLKTIIPPLVVNIFNVVIPYIFEFIIGLQGLEARSKIETKTLNHYFFFLLFNVLLVFTLSSAIISYIDLVIKNPYAVFNILAATLPNGATFFINYITIDIVFFGLEILRPAILIWNACVKMFQNTPRQIHEMNLATSYLNFGILYPIHILIFIIGLVYSVVAPIILIPTAVYFGVGYLVYRNQLLFVYVKEWEAYGRHWSMAFTRINIGLIIFQITMAGMFLIKGANYCAIVPLILIATTAIFYQHCKETFEKRTRIIPLDQLPPPVKQASRPFSPDQDGFLELDNDFDLSSLLPKSRKPSQKPRSNAASPNTSGPSLLLQSNPVIDADHIESAHSLPRSVVQNIVVGESSGLVAEDEMQAEEDLEPYVVLTPEESLSERYPVSYLNPVLSKPLPRPWLPVSVAGEDELLRSLFDNSYFRLTGYWQLLPRYISDPDLDVPDIVLNEAKVAAVSNVVVESPNVVTENLSPSAPELSIPAASPLSITPAQPGDFLVSRTSSATNPFASTSLEQLGSGENVAGSGSSQHLHGVAERVRRMTKKEQRRGSMSKGLMVVGMKGEISNSHEEVHLELAGGKVRKWKGSKEGGLDRRQSGGDEIRLDAEGELAHRIDVVEKID
ncbi:hypothetical protein BC830DRAFT_39856 [Chytriomyces sp. MP71]|nr:hypothetical protein BC830DRAFT_39856 [Chytriomyces sp. MP71]